MSVDEEQLEKLYLPSNWSKRYEAAELLARYLDFCQQTTSNVRCIVKHELNIPYGPTEKQVYDIYGTDLPNDAPIFLFIHGGYWQEFSKDQSGFVVPNLVANGIKVIIAGYDLCPNVKLSDIVREIKRLVQQVLALAHSSGSECVWIAGHSAGAHLAASLLHDRDWLDSISKCGYKEGLLKGLLLVSGIYALEPLVRVSVLNNCLKLDADEIKQFSFAPLATAEDCNTEGNCADATPFLLRNLKVLITVGECDSPIFIEESRRYARRLITMLDNVEFLLMRDNIDHFDIVENLTKPDFALSRMIVNNIKSF